MPLNIVLTNDDGFDAPGIQSMYAALTAAGFNVHIVAPHVNQSAQGSSLGGVGAIANPIPITEFSPGNYFVDGRPSVATMVALDDLFAGHPPDLVISGTNRGDNVGQSEDISGTVNAAVQALFNGVPAIAVSAGADASGSFNAGFANAATFIVDLVSKLQAAQAPGQPLLPHGEGLSVNVPGSAVLNGVAVTTISQESNGSFPIHETAPGSGIYTSTFVPAGASSGDPKTEGAQFLLNRITVSAIDGDWGATQADRSALESRLTPVLAQPSAPAHQPLDIMLVNDDGFAAPGLAAMRDSLLAAGYTVTVVAPDTNQSGVGSALTLGTFTVTRYDQGFHVGATPSTTVQTAIDALLTGADRPDLIISGANQGANVGIEVANHSGTVGAAVAGLFDYQIPSIAVSTAVDATGVVPAGLYQLTGNFMAELLADLQATQHAGPLLPTGIGLSINVPLGANPDNFAFTLLDAATNGDLSVVADPSQPKSLAHFAFGGPVGTANPFSEGNAFNAGKITITPIDGNFSAHDPALSQSIAELLGTRFGTPSNGFTVTNNSHGGHDIDLVIPAALTSAQGTGSPDLVRYDGSGVVNLPDNIDDVTLAGTGNSGVNGNALANIINGSAGDNRIVAAAGNDTVNGHDGNDVFVIVDPGHDGRDRYDGGAGSDTLDFSATSTPIDLDLRNGVSHFGSDTIVGIENLIGGSGRDHLGGNAQANELRGNAGNDDLDGKGGNDHLFGGDGNDTLAGGRGDDVLDGGNDRDDLHGGRGDDRLLGGAGDDRLDGGQGHDILVGGAGNDRLTGGGAGDQFVFNSLSDGIDTITDFAIKGRDQDQIVLARTLFQNFTGDDAFDLVGGGFLRAHAAGGHHTEVQVDVDGGGDHFATLAIIDGGLTSGMLADHTVVAHDPVV